MKLKATANRQGQNRVRHQEKKLDNTLLGKLENFTTVTTVHSTEKGALNSESAIAMAKYIMEARSNKAKALVGYQEDRRP